jgi:hypothetical protein
MVYELPHKRVRPHAPLQPQAGAAGQPLVVAAHSVLSRCHVATRYPGSSVIYPHQVACGFSAGAGGLWLCSPPWASISGSKRDSKRSSFAGVLAVAPRSTVESTAPAPAPRNKAPALLVVWWVKPQAT